MPNNFKISKTNNSRLSQLDFDNIPFGKVFSDHMFVADYIDGEWTNMEIVPFGNFEIHPACLALHYGQSIFEGMKATVDLDGRPLFFRPEKHIQRLNNSAARMCMPAVPDEMFHDAIHQLVSMDKDWIPPATGSALYIRPFMFGNGETIGVKASDTYKFIIFTGPVGPYYSKPVRLWVESEYVRAAKGGIGEAKASGNYAASLLPAQKAKAAGYDQILWLDASEFKYVQEVGTMNIFFVIDGKVITPITDGAILKGITRDTVMTILRAKGYEVEERLIEIDEIVQAHKAGTLTEVFGTGTAAVISHVADITYGEHEMVLPPMEERKVGALAKAEIEGLRNGTIADTRDWIVPAKQMVKV